MFHVGLEDDRESWHVRHFQALFSCGLRVNLVPSAWFGSGVNGKGYDPRGMLFCPLGR